MFFWINFTFVAPTGHSHHHHISLREQLQVAGGALQTSSQTGTPSATTPGQPKSIFGRLGIRKPSILSLSSPQPPTGSTARTFSLDDLLRPPPRRKTDVNCRYKLQYNYIFLKYYFWFISVCEKTNFLIFLYIQFIFRFSFSIIYIWIAKKHIFLIILFERNAPPFNTTSNW